jgi:hypothetical protein
VNTVRLVRPVVVALSAAAGAMALQAAAPSVLVLMVPGRASANVSLAANGQFVAAAWSASAPDGTTDIYAAASRDGGHAFSRPVRVNSTPGDARVNGEQPPRVALSARPGRAPGITVLWTAKGAAGTRLLSASSLDEARTFSPSRTVPGSDAPGNRGWESMVAGTGDRLFAAWLDHRRMAETQQAGTAAEHHHESATGTTATAQGGMAMSELSQLYVGTIDGTVGARGVTSGVCYCCKTAMAAGPGNALYVAWRHVYAGNLRDIAFTASRDGGITFTPPVRVSDDHWQINGCPEDGPSLAVDGHGIVHVVWPTVISEGGAPVKALFHAMTRDGRTFTSRVRLPIAGHANHPQMAIDTEGTLMVVWEESGSGVRHIGTAVGRLDRSGHVTFRRTAGEAEAGKYPTVVPVGAGAWLRAWTAGDPASSQIRIAPTS